MRIWYSLYDRLLNTLALSNAFAQVRRAKGAMTPGVDGMAAREFMANLPEELDRLVTELRTKTYQPQPVLRATIAKPEGGVRHLGIPTIRDRVVQQALLDILQPIFDPDFHPSSYGYRPGRSAKDAVAKATMFIRQYGLCHVVDMDLSKCFDRLDHDLIIASVRRRVTDGSILNLIRMLLESGVMADGVLSSTEVGSPQGGVVSPLLANIYLDAFDQQMRKRGHRIVRYADDILILCRSESGAAHAEQVATQILEVDLKLTVNKDKTHRVHARAGVKFLGVSIGLKWTSIQPKKIASLKAKVKRMTRRNSPVNLQRVIAELNRVLRGFVNYFQIANCSGQMRSLASWIRRRLRSKQLSLWKKPSRLHRRLRQLGYRGEFVKMRMRCWRSSVSHLASWSIPNSWLHEELGLFDVASVPTGVLPEVTWAT